MEREHDHVNVDFTLTINGMTIDEFQKEIEKLYSLLAEMKELSVFRDEDGMTSSEINGIRINNAPYVKANKIHGEHSWIRRLAEFGNGKGEGTD